MINLSLLLVFTKVLSLVITVFCLVYTPREWTRMEIDNGSHDNNSALSELLAVANKENQMLKELLLEARKRAEMSEVALQILSKHIEKPVQKQTASNFIKRIIVPIGKAIRIPKRKTNQKHNMDQ